jgi:hypothetical protein
MDGDHGGNGASGTGGLRRGRPPMTEEQRVMAVALLANAIRSEEHQRARARGRPLGDVLPGFGTRGRADASRRYVQGMRDLLAVLFDGGRAVADDCYREARAQALGDEPAS